MLHASDRASPRHEAALRFLEERASDPDVFCLAWATLMAHVRISTLISLPRVRAIGEGDGFLAAYRHATEGVVVRGNLEPDAHLATLLRQHGVRRLYTNDADFRKFPFLEVRDPFS